MTRKALIAEDDPSSALLLKTMLEKWGYVVVTAVDGKEALEKIRRDNDIQLVISDWMMPNMNGVDLCRQIRLLEGRPYAYLILLTAKAEVRDIVQGMEAGADDFVGKPFDQHELRARLHAGERVIELQNKLAEKLREEQRASEQMKRDLEAAAIIQNSMLPARNKILNGLRYTWRYQPCEQIGGDLFNVIDLDEGRVGIYIFDVSGHGVPAALQSVALGRMLSAFDPSASLLFKPGSNSGNFELLSPAEVVSQLNGRFQAAASRGDFITLLYGIFNADDLTFRFCRAGHPPPVHLSDGKSRPVVDDGGMPIGIMLNTSYTDSTMRLKKGDRLYFFTDGVTETSDSSGDLFGEKRLSALLEGKAQLGLDEGLEAAVSEITAWRKGAAQSDDFTILAIEVL